MTSRPDTSAASATASGWAQSLLRRQLDTLSRLAAAALRLVALATPMATPDRARSSVLALEKAVRVHGRVAWALRLIDALRAKLVDDLRRLRSDEPPPPSPEVRTFAAAAPETHPETERPGTAERPERGEWERPERFDRMFAGDDFSEILKRPTEEVIALICRELGLSPDWPRLAEEAWAREEGGLEPFPRRAQDEGPPTPAPP